MRLAAVLHVLSVAFCLPLLFADDNEKTLYISKLTVLYKNLTFANEATLLGETILPGIIINQLNSNYTHPGSYVHAKGVKINHLDLVSGDFSILLTTQCLTNGTITYIIDGAADFQTLDVKISNMQQLICKSLQYNTFNTFNNGSEGITELTEFEKTTKCERDGDQCKRGTVIVDPWLRQALQYQRYLSYNVPLNYVQFIGAHNSFNTKADGYGKGDFTLGKILEEISGGKWDFVWAQQWFSITDQLNMGVRYLMLDPVYFWGDMRLCHCGGGSVKWFDKAIEYIEKVLHIKIDFDSHDFGCMPYDRLFSSAIQEIYDWMSLAGNENEFVIVYINDQTSDSDWGHIDLIQNPVINITKDLLFTPTMKNSLFPTEWPSIKDILSMGKHLLFTCTTRCFNEYIFEEMMIPGWDKDTVKYFTPYSNCGDYHPPDWYLVGGESQVVGPIYDGPKEEGLVVKENLQDLLSCPLSVVQLDLVSPALMASAVWSWDVGYSIQNVSNHSCPVMDHNGRWMTIDCNNSLYHVCVSDNNQYTFNISSTANTWTHPQCQNGLSFGLPWDGYQNHIVLVNLIIKHQLTKIWINATTAIL